MDKKDLENHQMFFLSPNWDTIMRRNPAALEEFPLVTQAEVSKSIMIGYFKQVLKDDDLFLKWGFRKTPPNLPSHVVMLPEPKFGMKKSLGRVGKTPEVIVIEDSEDEVS